MPPPAYAQDASTVVSDDQPGASLEATTSADDQASLDDDTEKTEKTDDEPLPLERKLKVIHSSTFALEYDDNVNLANGIDEEKKEDWFFQYMPYFIFLRQYKAHEFSLDLNADYRKSLTTDLSELNYSIAGIADLNYPGGLRIRLEETYMHSRFDLDPYEYFGAQEIESNLMGVNVYYKFVERLKAEGGYSWEWEKSDFYRRDIYTLQGKLDVPVTRSTVAYLFYKNKDNRSDDVSTWNYDYTSYGVGARWTGPYRFVFWGEVGFEDVNFDDDLYDDYENTVYRIGAEVKFTEHFRGEFTFGTDAFNNTVYHGELIRRPSNEEYTMLTYEKDTHIPFTLREGSSTFESRQLIFRHMEYLADQFRAELEGRYILQDSIFKDKKYREDETLLGKITLSWVRTEHFKIGAYYQYSDRNSNIDLYDYTDNRFGVSLTIGF